MTGDSATFGKLISRTTGPTWPVRVVLTLTLRAEHKVALRGGTRGLLLLPVDGRGGVGRHGNHGDPAGTVADRTLDLPLPVRELLALL